MPLFVDYRPESLDEVYGNEIIVNSLRKILKREEGIPHSYLFTGPSGCGKTTFARIIQNEIGCSDFDFEELDASTDRGIDKIRNIKRMADYAPMQGDVKIYFLDECHGVTGDAQEALLKLLEEPPDHVFIILCTTEPEKLKSTIKRRCIKFELNPLSFSELTELMEDIMEAEEKEPDKAIIDMIKKRCQGSPGIALNLLDSVIDLEPKERIKALESVTYSETEVIDLCRALIKKDSWKQIADLLKDFKGDPESARYAIKAYLGKVLLSKGESEIANILDLFLNSFRTSGKEGLILACYYSTTGG